MTAAAHKPADKTRYTPVVFTVLRWMKNTCIHGRHLGCKLQGTSIRWVAMTCCSVHLFVAHLNAFGAKGYEGGTEASALLASLACGLSHVHMGRPLCRHQPRMHQPLAVA
jgi:hypothetical protein